MPAMMEAIDRMSSDERVKTMEYLWAAMTAAAFLGVDGNDAGQMKGSMQ